MFRMGPTIRNTPVHPMLAAAMGGSVVLAFLAVTYELEISALRFVESIAHYEKSYLVGYWTTTTKAPAEGKKV